MADAILINELFFASVMYNKNVNLNNFLDNAEVSKDKKYLQCSNPYFQKKKENPFCTGTIILANGPCLLDELVKKEEILDDKTPQWESLHKYGTTVNYLEERLGDDGGWIVNGDSKEIAQIKTFSNNPPHKEPINLAQRIAYDFASHPTQPHQGEVGSKSNLAVRYAASSDHLKTILLRTSCYASGGIGMSAQFGGKGLERTVHFEYRPELAKLNPLNISTVDVKNEKFKNSLVAVYREYMVDSTGQTVCDESKTQILDLSKIQGNIIPKESYTNLENRINIPKSA